MSHQKCHLYQQGQSNKAESEINGHLHSRNGRFSLNQVHCTASVNRCSLWGTKEPMASPNVQHMQSFCTLRICVPNKNTVARLKSNILVPQILGLAMPLLQCHKLSVICEQMWMRFEWQNSLSNTLGADGKIDASF